jgi:2-polyprenyl-3-methyl-5-hydroxy-6-metoxy-1,4-benzoquinol methylase
MGEDEVEQLISYIGSKNPLHLKKIRKNFNAAGGMRQDLGNFLSTYRVFMDANGVSTRELADAYLDLIEHMSCARIAFMRTGKYPIDSHEEAVETVYNNKDVMTKYMLGLAMSQFIWKHHYDLFQFFRGAVQRLTHFERCMEIGSGHGLFLLELFRLRKDVRSFDVVDLSPISLDLTQRLISALDPVSAKKVNFTQMDFVQFKPKGKVDFLIMGEVLEHVKRPEVILDHIRDLLSEDGKAFISTCVNCPTIDHLYHFRSIDEVRDLIRRSGLVIEDEVISPSEDVSPEALERLKLDISYGAIVSLTSA